jgi:hypothetical protein
MADNIRATPQNAALGSIANFLKQSYGPERTQQMQGMMEFLGVPAVARTIERISYGEPITNINKANVPLLPEDTAEAAMMVAPPLTSMAKRVGTNLVQTAPYVARDMMQSMADPMKSYVIKPKGGNWLAGKIEKSIEPLKIQGLPDLTGTGEIPLDPGPAAINKWLDTKLNKYIKNEMGTAEDPLRELAERGVVAGNFGTVGRDDQKYLEGLREAAGFPSKGLAKSRLARKYEALSDLAISQNTAGTYTGSTSGRPYTGYMDANPWLSKVPPETKVYELIQPNPLTDDLGFNHVIDELKNAIDPNSTLPANLRLKYTDLDKVTVPQAVERVAKINDWRAAQAAEAEKAGMLDNLTATPRLQDPTTQLSFVEKPGMTWVDIPATTDEKANKLCTTIGKQAGWCTQGRDLAESYGSGNNRLTTLLDAEGRPHVQAMITQQSDELRRADFLKQLSEEQYNNVLKADPQQVKIMFEEWSSKNPLSFSISELKPVGNDFDSARAQEYLKRDPQYQAKITDSVLKFLNAGEWGRVKDLGKYGIVDLQDTKSVVTGMVDALGHIPSRDRSTRFNEAIDMNPDAQRFMSLNQFREFVDPNFGKEGFQAGGLVKGAVKNIGEMVQKYMAKEASEAAAKEAVKEQKMLQGFYRGYAGENEPAKTAFGSETYFVSPQRKVADYYAQRRAAETGAEPHAEMILADPFFTRNNPYGLSIPIDKYNRDFLVTRARRVDPDEVKSRTPLYAEGGSVSSYDPFQVDEIMNSINAPQNYAQGGSVSAYDPDQIDAIANQFM